MPSVAEKTNSGVTVPSTQWADVVSCWSISLVSGLPRLSLCLSLFGKCIFKLGKALLHCLPPSRTLWSQGFPSVDINDQGLQVSLADIFMRLFNVRFAISNSTNSLAFDVSVILPPFSGKGINWVSWVTDHLIPFPLVNINTYFSLRAKCWLMGGVGGQLPHPNWSFYVVILGSRLNGVWMNEIFISQRNSEGIRLLALTLTCTSPGSFFFLLTLVCCLYISKDLRRKGYLFSDKK